MAAEVTISNSVTPTSTGIIYIKDRYLGFEFSFFSKSVGSGPNMIYANITIDTTQNKFIRLNFSINIDRATAATQHSKTCHWPESIEFILD